MSAPTRRSLVRIAASIYYIYICLHPQTSSLRVTSNDFLHVGARPRRFKVDEAESLNSERDFADRGGSASQTPRGNPLIGEVLFLRKILRARLY